MYMKETEFDLADLLSVFDELLPLSDEDRKIYWLRFTRSDGITITLTLSTYEMTVGLIVQCNSQVACSATHLKHCSRVRVLEMERRTLEVLCSESTENVIRCFLSLDGENILTIENDVGRPDQT